MRLISGSFKGRKIRALPDNLTRPTTDRVREAWASSLASLAEDNSFGGMRVLDAFAGSGALGLELLSRGAQECLFIEKNRAAMAVLKDNIASLGLTKTQARTCQADSLATPLPSSLLASKPFDLIALDPPYALPQERIARFILALSSSGLIANKALISYEHAAGQNKQPKETLLEFVPELDGLNLVRTKEYGTICIDYYQLS